VLAGGEDVGGGVGQRCYSRKRVKGEGERGVGSFCRRREVDAEDQGKWKAMVGEACSVNEGGDGRDGE